MSKPTLSLLFALGIFLLGAPSNLSAQDTLAQSTKVRPPRNFTPLFPGLKIEDNVVYKTVGEQKLVLSVIYPAVKKYDPAPLVVYIHGGGWLAGDRVNIRNSGVTEVFKKLSADGFVCAAIEYRLMTPQGSTVMESVADCKDAIHFLVKNAARFGLDPNRIGLIGGSAGGHLSLVTALGADADYPGDPDLAKYPGKILAEVAYFPATTLVDPKITAAGIIGKKNMLPEMLGGSLVDKMDAAKKLSPTLLLNSDAPPLRLVHGEQDATLSDMNSITLAQVGKDKGVPVELVLVKKAGHGFSGKVIDPTIPQITQGSVDFFLKYLTPPAAAGK